MTVPERQSGALEATPAVRVPRWLVAVMGVCLVAAVAMMLAGGWLGGVTWDEKTHVLMLGTFLDQGWNVSPDALVGGVPDPSYIWGVYVYGPVGELVAHAFAAALGTEPWGTPSLDAAAYAGRHVGIAVMALAGIAAAGWIVRTVTGSWAWGLIGATVLAVTPVWLGHGMFNIKDIPVAAGYTIASAGAVALLRTDYLTRLPVRLAALVALTAGAVLGAGTRAAIGVPIAAGVVIGLLAFWLARWRQGEASLGVVTKDALRRLAEAAGALVVGYLILVAIYPKAFFNPVVLAWEALVVSARFPYDEAVLTSGTWMEQPPPWTYLPQWFLAQLPSRRDPRITPVSRGLGVERRPAGAGTPLVAHGHHRGHGHCRSGAGPPHADAGRPAAIQHVQRDTAVPLRRAGAGSAGDPRPVVGIHPGRGNQPGTRGTCTGVGRCHGRCRRPPGRAVDPVPLQLRLPELGGRHQARGGPLADGLLAVRRA